MFSRHTAGGLVAHVAGRAAIFSKPAAYIALFTTAPSDDSGTGAVEPPGAGYARVATSAATWSAATAPPPLIANAAAIQFATATASWGTILAAGLYDAATGGNLLAWDWLGNYGWNPATISAAAPAVIALPGHGFAAGDNAMFTTVFGGTAPAFSQSNLAGLLAAAAITNDSFTATNGGTAVATSGTGNGMVRKVVPLTVPAGVTPVFPAGTLLLLMGSASARLVARASGFASARARPAAGMPLAARSGATGPGRGGVTASGSSGFVLGTGTSAGDALGAGTGSSDLLGVQ